MSETWAKQPGDDQRPGAAASGGPAEPGGLDLHLDLSGTRVRAELESALRGAIRAGRLRPGTRLPSSRALAADLGIARNTVAEVYSQLVAEGWLTAQTGSGTSVAPRRAAEPGGAVAARPEVAIPRYDLRAGGRAGLVIGYGRPPEHAYTTALARLCAVLPSGTEILTGSLPARAW